LSPSLRLGYFIQVDSFLLVLFDGIRIGGDVKDDPLLQEEGEVKWWLNKRKWSTPRSKLNLT